MLLKRIYNRSKKLIKFYIKDSTTPGNQYIEAVELTRLINMPRFVATETLLFGTKIKIVDACTYLNSINEIFEGELYKFTMDKSSGITIIDCGANIGMATIYFKKNFPEARIIAFEPDPNICEAMKHNIDSFAYNNVEVVNAAVSNIEGNLHFLLEGGHSGMLTENPLSESVITIKAIRLKSVLEKLDQITFLKLDIEGHEVKVLPDIENELQKVKFLFLEYHSFSNEEQQLDMILSIIKKAGFRYYIKESYIKKLPFISREIFLKMDLLVNIFCFRD